MRAVIQRVIEANVRINGEIKDAIGTGFMVLLGIEHDDTIDDIDGAHFQFQLADADLLGADAELGPINVHLAVAQ